MQNINPEKLPPFGTVSKEYSKFLQMTYPDGITGEEEKQIHQAFAAGSLTMAFRAITTIIHEKDNHKVAKALADMVKDADQSCRDLIHQ